MKNISSMFYKPDHILRSPIFHHKFIISRSYLHTGKTIVISKYFHIRHPLQGAAAFCYLRICRRGKIYSRSCISRDCYLKFKDIPFLLPITYDCSVYRFITAIYPRNIAGRLRLDHNFTETGSPRGDSSQRLIHPLTYTTEMI